MTRQINFSKGDKKPLQLQAHKPVPIPSYVPKFDDGGGNSRFDPDSARNEQSRLKAMVRKEKKGALKELRKDNRFLATEEFKRRKEDDEQYQQKVIIAETLVQFLFIYHHVFISFCIMYTDDKSQIIPSR